MKTLFFGTFLASSMLINFDTQDEIFMEAFNQSWKPQEKKTMLVKRETYRGKDVLRVHVAKPTKKILLWNFAYSYKVQKINQHEFLIHCKDFQKHWNKTDNINILFIN